MDDVQDLMMMIAAMAYLLTASVNSFNSSRVPYVSYISSRTVFKHATFENRNLHFAYWGSYVPAATMKKHSTGLSRPNGNRGNSESLNQL